MIAGSFVAALAVAGHGPHAHFKLLGRGQCNGGVGGTGDHKCLIGGHCNEGSAPSGHPTVDGKCPYPEYLLCTEDLSVTLETCRSACQADTTCVGFMLSHHLGNGAGRCELHIKTIEYVAKPLQCYTYAGGVFSLLGEGACRTKEVTASGPAAGTHYGHMEVQWVAGQPECEAACRNNTACVGVEYHRSPTANGNKCEVHFQELSRDHMSVFECWGPETCKNSHTCAHTERPGGENRQCSDEHPCSEDYCCYSHDDDHHHDDKSKAAIALALVSIVLALVAVGASVVALRAVRALQRVRADRPMSRRSDSAESLRTLTFEAVQVEAVSQGKPEAGEQPRAEAAAAASPKQP
eukprot:TRINITY_DN9259_c0_g1_i1.p1 TRINITY_DN9259_c0_g1~~TRINITY_DN9259_c0_g1_i1.p1  ORF type:complete len:368 (+),score=114.28 TRINITY_DN9259_c0_g1_i1:54-1106(+)